jgi:tetratricopeptide (TPR) repeat protein
MNLRIIILILISTFLSSHLAANFANDSLLQELKNTPQNKEKTLLLNKLSRTFINSNLDSSIYYAKNGLALASEIEYSLGIAENAASMADYYVIYDSLNEAKEYYTLAAKYFDELDMDFDLAELLMVLGNIYLSQSNYSEALMYYQKSQHISEENNFNTILPHIYNNTGIIYINLGEKEKALNHLMKAYKGFKTLDLKENVAHAVSNIASIHLNDSKDSLAINYYNEALKMFKETGNLIGASYIYLDLGNNEFDKGNYTKALEYYNEGHDQIVSQSTEYLGPKSRALVAILGNLGRVHYHLGNKQKAIEYLEESLALARQNHYINWIESSTYELSKIYESEGEFDKALKYFKTYEQYGDSILNESSIKRITQLEMQFEFDKEMKERELEDARRETAQQRKEFIYLLFISLGVFIAIIAILMYINQRSKTSRIELKRQNLKLEHEKLQQELEHRNKELATNVMYLLSKNEFITSTAEKLAKAKMSFKQENQKIIQDIIRDLLFNSSKDVWKEFEVRFQDVHSEFYNNLNKKFPDLTPNEKKICAFLRLNMSTKDICAITYQSVRSINMARFRLRKKMELDTDENLVAILSQI